MRYAKPIKDIFYPRDLKKPQLSTAKKFASIPKM